MVPKRQIFPYFLVSRHKQKENPLTEHWHSNLRAFPVLLTSPLICIWDKLVSLYVKLVLGCESSSDLCFTKIWKIDYRALFCQKKLCQKIMKRWSQKPVWWQHHISNNAKQIKTEVSKNYMRTHYTSSIRFNDLRTSSLTV